MTKRQKQPRRTNDRQAVILNLLREFPNNKFSLKHLASASGGNTREGRRDRKSVV